jgi:hypothetical protein
MSLPVDASRIRWRKASRSSGTGSDCVEIAGVENAVAIRDSKDPTGPKLVVSRAAWRELSRRAAKGELDAR